MQKKIDIYLQCRRTFFVVDKVYYKIPFKGEQNINKDS